MRIINNEENINIIEQCLNGVEIRGIKYVNNIIIKKKDDISTVIQLEEDKSKFKTTNVLGVITKISTFTENSNSNFAILLKLETSFNNSYKKYNITSFMSGYYILIENNIIYTFNFEIDYDTVQYSLNIELQDNYELKNEGNVMDNRIIALSNEIDSHLEYIYSLNAEDLKERLETLNIIVTIQENLYAHFSSLIRNKIREFNYFLKENLKEPKNLVF